MENRSAACSRFTLLFLLILSFSAVANLIMCFHHIFEAQPPSQAAFFEPFLWASAFPKYQVFEQSKPKKAVHPKMKIYSSCTPSVFMEG